MGTCAFAFDLGISNAQVAVCCHAGAASLVRDGDGATSLPMVVACAEGKMLVGHAAKRQQLINPATVFGISRLLGRRFESAAVSAMQRRLPFRLSGSRGGGVAVQLGKKCCSAEEVCSLLLRRLRQTAEEYIGEPITEVHIAVPAYFDAEQRQALEAAARQAGLSATVLDSSHAALRALFPEQLPAGTRQAVMHLGGGSCEVTLLDVGQLGAEKVLEGGDAFLGGNLLDSAIVDLLLAEAEAAGHPELRNDPVCRQRIQEAAERAKWDAGERGEAHIALPHLHASGEQELHLELLLPRDRLEELARPLLAGVLDICRITLERARLEPRQLDGAILVGGQTRLQCVREAVSDFFGIEPYWEAEPEGTVARGAALEALLVKDPPTVELDL